MKIVGYSEKSVLEKLGFRPDENIMALGAPSFFREELQRSGISIGRTLPATHAHLFMTERVVFEKTLKSLNLQAIEKSLWVSWPKKTSRVKTDITEETLREVVLPLGWVDVKVIAIDDTWSGLKFLRRKK